MKRNLVLIVLLCCAALLDGCAQLQVELTLLGSTGVADVISHNATLTSKLREELAASVQRYLNRQYNRGETNSISLSQSLSVSRMRRPTAPPQNLSVTSSVSQKSTIEGVIVLKETVLAEWGQDRNGKRQLQAKMCARGSPIALRTALLQLNVIMTSPFEKWASSLVVLFTELWRHLQKTQPKAVQRKVTASTTLRLGYHNESSFSISHTVSSTKYHASVYLSLINATWTSQHKFFFVSFLLAGNDSSFLALAEQFKAALTIDLKHAVSTSIMGTINDVVITSGHNGTYINCSFVIDSPLTTLLVSDIFPLFRSTSFLVLIKALYQQTKPPAPLQLAALDIREGIRVPTSSPIQPLFYFVNCTMELRGVSSVFDYLMSGLQTADSIGVLFQDLARLLNVTAQGPLHSLPSDGLIQLQAANGLSLAGGSLFVQFYVTRFDQSFAQKDVAHLRKLAQSLAALSLTSFNALYTDTFDQLTNTLAISSPYQSLIVFNSTAQLQIVLPSVLSVEIIALGNFKVLAGLNFSLFLRYFSFDMMQWMWNVKGVTGGVSRDPLANVSTNGVVTFSFAIVGLTVNGTEEAQRRFSLWRDTPCSLWLARTVNMYDSMCKFFKIAVENSLQVIEIRLSPDLALPTIPPPTTTHPSQTNWTTLPPGVVMWVDGTLLLGGHRALMASLVKESAGQLKLGLKLDLSSKLGVSSVQITSLAGGGSVRTAVATLQFRITTIFVEQANIVANAIDALKESESPVLWLVRTTEFYEASASADQKADPSFPISIVDASAVVRQQGPPSEGGLSGWIILGIVIGCIVIVAQIIGIALCFLKKGPPEPAALEDIGETDQPPPEPECLDQV